MLVKVVRSGMERVIECDEYSIEDVVSGIRWRLFMDVAPQDKKKCVYDEILGDGSCTERVYIVQHGKTVDSYTYACDRTESKK